MALKPKRLENRADEMIMQQENEKIAMAAEAEPDNSASEIVREIKNLESTKTSGNKTKKEQKKKTVGRPKTKGLDTELKHIHLTLTEEMYTNIQYAKIKYGNNLTFYIESLIKQDLNKNLAEYKKLHQMINS